MQCAVFFVAAAIVMSRRPDLIFHAHFYGEDGTSWYGDAYNSRLAPRDYHYGRRISQHAATTRRVARFAGTHSLCATGDEFCRPGNSSFAGLLLALKPLRALVATADPYFSSGTLYFASQYARNSHHPDKCAISPCVAGFSRSRCRTAKHWAWKAFDVTVLAISALSGPFCIVILPLVAVLWWLRRQRWSLVVMAILFPLIALQGVELTLGGYAGRAPANLGATPMLLARLLSGHVFVGSLWGENGFVLNAQPVAVIVVLIFGTSIVSYAFIHGSLELRLFIILAFSLFAASLSKPLIGGNLPQWQLLAIDRSARYWFFPMLAVSWSLLFCVTQNKSRLARMGSGFALLALLHGLVHDHRYPPFPDQNFRIFLRAFEAAPPGTLIAVPDGPPGKTAYLRKK